MELRHVRRTGKAIGGFSIHDRETYHISLRVEGVKLYGIERDAEWDRGCYSGRSEGPYELAPAHGAACLLDALGLFCAPSLARPIYLDAGKENFGRDWEVAGCGLAPRFEGTFTEANRLVISSPFWAGDRKTSDLAFLQLSSLLCCGSSVLSLCRGQGRSRIIR